MSCGQDCKCGSQSKPCRNKVICSRKVDKMLDLLLIFIQISWKRCKFAIFGEKTFVVLAKEMCCNPHDLSCRIIMRSCTVLIYFWINAHRLFFLVWQYTLSVYILVSHFSSTNVVIILNKNIHYCLFLLIFYLSLTRLYSNFGRANGAQTVCQKSTMWIREHGLHT